jgi:hypothetical protein
MGGGDVQKEGKKIQEILDIGVSLGYRNSAVCADRAGFTVARCPVLRRERGQRARRPFLK